MSYCGQCGGQVTTTASFCKDCGAPVRPAQPLVATAPVAPLPRPPRSARSRRRLSAIFVVTSGVVAALVAGWVTHLIPIGPTAAHAEGTAVAAESLNPGEQELGADDPAPGVDEAMTAFTTSCGKLLDIVPTEAVSTETAVRVTLEVRPVCPTGEWIDSSSFRVVLRGGSGATGGTAAGAVVADGTFDLSGAPLLVPGFGDPTSVLEATYGTGTAWMAPDQLTVQIRDGLVMVECEALDGAPSTDLDGDTGLEASTTAVEAVATDAPDLEETALAALQRQVALDDPTVSGLEGAWVAQLSSKKQGTFDEHDGRSYSLADIYQQFLSLRLLYPNVLLLNSTDWESYTLTGYWVVIAGVPYNRPGLPNQWCTERDIPPSQCFAKRLVRDGAPTGTTKHRD